ncbi:hypothetical protein AGMMS49991_03710 [Spirochaetia bacterium]|nr:hypothetical protein AGMMS49991_03710 [Spirochaetia bacterium]
MFFAAASRAKLDHTFNADPVCIDASINPIRFFPGLHMIGYFIPVGAVPARVKKVPEGVRSEKD